MCATVNGPAFYGRMDLHYVDGRVWELHNPDEHWGMMSREGIHIVPIDGFLTDFASVPRLFWRIFPPTGNGKGAAYGPAAVIHDWLYQMGDLYGEVIERGWADDVFMDGMRALGVSKARRWPIYLAVRAFGWVVWDRYRRGERG